MPPSRPTNLPFTPAFSNLAGGGRPRYPSVADITGRDACSSCRPPAAMTAALQRKCLDGLDLNDARQRR